MISIIQRTTASLVLYGVNFNTCMYVPQLIVFLEKKVFFFFKFFTNNIISVESAKVAVIIILKGHNGQTYQPNDSEEIVTYSTNRMGRIIRFNS